MASQFGIVEADITPAVIPDHIYEQLTDYDGDGTADVTIADVIVDAELEFISYLGAMLAGAGNIALAKPHVIHVAIYHLHARREQNSDYEIPSSVLLRYKQALEWAEEIGRGLLAAEGTVDPPGTAEIEVDYPVATHTMTQLDNL